MRAYYIWINGKYDSIKAKYVWPSNGEPITQYPHTYSSVASHDTYYGRTTPVWVLEVPNSNSYLNAYTKDVKVDSILCLNKNLLSLPSNPCSTTDQVNNTFWFGTFINCKRDVYSKEFARDHCPTGQVLAEVMNASLYRNITDEISIRTRF